MLFKPSNWHAQRDPHVVQEQTLGLTPWVTHPDGSFTSYDALNNGHSLQEQPDGSLILEVHSGGIDHPGTSGGDRAGLGISNAQAATASCPAGTVLVGVHGRELWYRLDLDFPSGVNVLPLKCHSNVSEWHGRAGGGSVLKLGVDGAGLRYGIAFAPLILGVWGHQQWLGQIPIVLDERHVWDIGVLWTSDATGRVHVHRDNELVGVLDGVQTMKTFADASTENVAFALQLYRSPTDPSGNPLPPSQLRVHRFGMADSLDQLEAI